VRIGQWHGEEADGRTLKKMYSCLCAISCNVAQRVDNDVIGHCDYHLRN
jgi:hypothetical protein